MAKNILVIYSRLINTKKVLPKLLRNFELIKNSLSVDHYRNYLFILQGNYFIPTIYVGWKIQFSTFIEDIQDISYAKQPLRLLIRRRWAKWNKYNLHGGVFHLIWHSQPLLVFCSQELLTNRQAPFDNRVRLELNHVEDGKASQL